jgi:DNA-binding transcriptional LysR family regulator
VSGGLKRPLTGITKARVLPEFSAPPVQVFLLYPHRKNIAPRVVAVLNWIIQISQPSMLEQV